MREIETIRGRMTGVDRNVAEAVTQRVAAVIAVGVAVGSGALQVTAHLRGMVIDVVRLSRLVNLSQLVTLSQLVNDRK